MAVTTWQLSTLVLYACVLVTRCHALLNQHCETPKPAEFTVSVLHSYRNNSGNWFSQVKLVNREKRGVVTSREPKWSVDITQNSENCGDESVHEVLLTFVGPPPKYSLAYQYFPQLGFYRLHPQGETWARARDLCSEDDAHLVVINSEKEAGAVVELFKRYPKINSTNSQDWAWVGVHESPVKNQYVTVFGAPLNSTGFTRWRPGHPNRVNTVDDALFTFRNDGGLGDTANSLKLGFICELEL